MPIPLVIGREIVGKVVSTGSEVVTMKKGDKVGVSSQVWGCLNAMNVSSTLKATTTRMRSVSASFFYISLLKG